MIDEDIGCSKLLTPIAYDRTTLDNVGKTLSENHLGSCMVEAVKPENQITVLGGLKEAVSKFL